MCHKRKRMGWGGEGEVSFFSRFPRNPKCRDCRILGVYQGQEIRVFSCLENKPAGYVKVLTFISKFQTEKKCNATPVMYPSMLNS